MQKVYKDSHLTNKSEALFGREDFIDALVNFIVSQSTDVNTEADATFRNQKDNLTIGLYGKWGMGKTSIIHSAKTELEKQGFLAIYFDPWMYKSEDLLIYDLFKFILQAIGVKDKTLKAKASGFLKKYAEYITLPKIKFGEIEVDASDTGKNLLKDLGEFLSEEETIEYYKNEINSTLKELANPITIFIDDIDRLNKEEIQVLFKTIRLIADFNNVIYVLSFDDEMVAKSVKDNFASGTVEDGFNYLDKIVQIPLRVPEIPIYELFNYCLILADIKSNLSNPNFDNLKSLFYLSFKTPRDCKRFVNGFNFTKHNLTQIDKFELFFIELVRVKMPKLFQFIREFNLSLSFPNPSEIIINKSLLEATEKIYSLNEKINSKISIQYTVISRILSTLFGLDFSESASNNDWPSLAVIYKKRADTIKTNTFSNPRILKLYFQFKKSIGEV